MKYQERIVADGKYDKSEHALKTLARARIKRDQFVIFEWGSQLLESVYVMIKSIM
jgi:hypothetical protein